MIAAAILALFVLFIFIRPIKKQHVDFDERAELIKIYQDEKAYIEKQYQMGFIDEIEKKHLIEDLELKSSSAISNIARKHFAYRLQIAPWLLFVLVTTFTLGLYFIYLQNQQIHRWQQFKQTHEEAIVEGLFDADKADIFLKSQPSLANHYCFAMQQRLLANYPTNADALANLANCHLNIGYPTIAREAIDKGLGSQPQHPELNFLTAEMNFVENQQLSSEDLDNLFVTIKAKPNHKGALRLLGVNSLNTGQYTQAKFFFDKLREIETDPEVLTLLTEIDEIIQSNQNLELPSATESESVQSPQPTEQPTTQPTDQPTKETNEAPETATTPSPASLTIPLTVELAPELASTITFPKDIFVVVKSPDGAIINASKYQITQPDDILNIQITDNMPGAMQMQPLSAADAVTVTARLSLSGQPIASQGDLTSAAVTVDLPTESITPITIDSVVP